MFLCVRFCCIFYIEERGVCSFCQIQLCRFIEERGVWLLFASDSAVWLIEERGVCLFLSSEPAA